MELKTRNAIYKKFIGEKEVPYDTFIEVETRKFASSPEKAKVDFDTWLNRKYARSGKNAWFNKATKEKLDEIGFLNITAQEVEGWGKSAGTAVDTFGKTLNLFKKDKTGTTASQPSRSYTPPAKQGMSTGAVIAISIGAIAFTAIMATAIIISARKK